jgi:hypothetical protein
MQNTNLQSVLGNSQQCVSKTSPPGQRCLEPLHGLPDESDTFNSSFDIVLEYFAYFEELNGNGSDEADAPSPFLADALSPISAAAPSQSNTSALPDDDTLCVNMACSAEGRVLVDGKLCDPGAPFAQHLCLFQITSSAYLKARCEVKI